MSVVQLEEPSPVAQIAYQEHEVSLTQREGIAALSQLAYQEQETERVAVADTDTRESGTVTMNVLPTPLLGRAYLFDGSSFKELGTPVAVIYPALASSDSRAYLAGGLGEGGEVPSYVYGLGAEVYVLVADRDYLAMVAAGGAPVYVVDPSGSTSTAIQGVATVPLLAGWRLVSRSPFVAILQRI